MLKVKISRKAAEDAVRYHAEESMGVDPVIETDEDLADWLVKIYDELEGGEPIEVEVIGQDVILKGSNVTDFVGHHIN